MQKLILFLGLSYLLTLTAFPSTGIPFPEERQSSASVEDGKRVDIARRICANDSENQIDADMIRVEYVSKEGRALTAIFDNVIHTIAIAMDDGKVYTLPLAISGSGARYANDDESVVFWIKGDDGTLWINEKIAYVGAVKKIVPME